MKGIYGKELILDLHECDTTNFTRDGLSRFFVELCDAIDMKRCDLHFWDYDTEEEMMQQPAHLAGVSAIQFITTSNITVHTLNKLHRVYLNIFSCKDFDADIVVSFCEKFFSGKAINRIVVDRI